MRRTLVALVIVLLAAYGIAGCVRHVELTPIDAAVDAPHVAVDVPGPDAAVPDAMPDAAVDAM